MTDDYLHAIDQVAAAADARAEAQERADAYQDALDELREWAKVGKDYLTILRQEGIPAMLARGVVRDHLDNLSHETLRRSFRGR